MIHRRSLPGLSGAKGLGQAYQVLRNDVYEAVVRTVDVRDEEKGSSDN
jgi:hypothetical protein